MGEPTNLRPIQILVHYWELRPQALAQKLDELIRHGIQHLATFVPWQAVESDIAHTLPRFLQAARDRRLTVSLILTPELGVHYPYSGLPKDIFSQSENLALHEGGGNVPVLLPPIGFALPSLSAPEVGKRYHNFLARIDSLLADLGRNQPKLLEGVTAVLGGGFWKYYRDPARVGERAFTGIAGDFSNSSQLSFRQRVDQQFSSREFQDPSPTAAQRWKSRALEGVNRRWFAHQNEEVFRMRSSQSIRKKALGLQVHQAEIFTPEADPSLAMSRFLQVTGGARADFKRLSALVVEASSRASCAAGSAAEPFIHWTKLGPYRSLSAAERQFLIFQSLLLCGSRGGGVLIDEAEWFSLSPAFRARADGLARQMAQGNFKLPTAAYYLVPHLWSEASDPGHEMARRLGPSLRYASSIERAASDTDASLVVVDPNWILNRDSIQRLLSLARSGKVVALPRSPLYTDAARRELAQGLVDGPALDIPMGVSCSCISIGAGQLVLFDVPEGASEVHAEKVRTLVTGLLGLAQIHPDATVSDGRLRVVSLKRKHGGLGVFLLNATQRRISGDLYFTGEVTISDLALVIRSEGAGAKKQAGDGASSRPAARFGLEVPPLGILPINVEGLGTESEERRLAALSGQMNESNVLEAAASELPGFSESGSGMEAVWN